MKKAFSLICSTLVLALLSLSTAWAAQDIVLSLEDTSGSLFYVPSGQSATVLCSDYSGNSYAGTISSGNRTVTISVAEEQYYTCSLTGLTTYAATSKAYAYVSSASPVYSTFYLTPINSLITLTVVDQNGNAVTAANGYTATCYDSSYINSFSATFSGNSVSIGVVGNTYYSCSLASQISGYSYGYSTYVYVANSETVSAEIKVTLLDSTLNINFVDPSGAAVIVPSGSSASIYCSDLTTGQNYIYQSISSGISSISIPVAGGIQYQCYTYSILNYEPGNASIFVPASNTSILNIPLQRLDSTITINLKSSGAPLSVPTGTYYASLSCYSIDSGAHYYGQQLNVGDSSVTVNVVSGKYQCSIYGITNYYPSAPINVTAPAEGSVSGDLDFYTTDAQITVRLRSSNTDYIIESGGYAYVYCSSSIGYFWGSITEGLSSVDIAVVGGSSSPISYSCSGWIANTASIGTTVSVSSAENKTADIDIRTRSASVTVQFRDQDGNLITDLLNAIVYAYSTDPTAQDYGSAVVDGGIANLTLVDGLSYATSYYATYSSSGYGLLETSSGVKYVQSYLLNEVTPSDSAPTTVTITLTRADASVQVTTVNASGTPVPSWVTVFEDTSQSEISSALYLGGWSNESGQVTVDVPSGRRYNVIAYNTGTDFTLIPPSPQEVTPSPGETTTVTLTYTVADYALTISPVLVSDSISGYISCYGYTLSGKFSSGNKVDTEQPLIMYITSTEDWIYTCSAYITAADGSSSIYASAPVSYTPLNGESSDTVDANLELLGTGFSETLNFDPNNTSSLTASDGAVKVDVPAGTFSVSSVNLKVDNSEIPSGDGINNPIPGCTVNLDAKNATNNTGITPTEGKTLNVSVNCDLTAKEIEGAAAGYYDEETGSWKPVQFTEEDSATSSLSLNRERKSTSILKFRNGQELLTKRYKLSTGRLGQVGLYSQSTEPQAVTELGGVENIKVICTETNRTTCKLTARIKDGEDPTGFTVTIYRKKNNTLFRTKSFLTSKVAGQKIRLNLGRFSKNGTYRLVIAATRAGFDASEEKTKRFKVTTIL